MYKFLILSFLICLTGCNTTNSDENNSLIYYPSILSNLSSPLLKQDSIQYKTIHLDYINAMEGFNIPTKRQITEGGFSFSFEVNPSEKKKLFYKIYYQNESYKFPETLLDGKYNPFCEENFYGSFSDSSINFKEITSNKITDFISITGNPRHEEKYFSGGVNHRYQCNPRLGFYKFILVITDDLEKIPYHIQNIHVRNKEEHYVNPFWYFSTINGKDKAVQVIDLKEQLKVEAHPPMNTGIYVPLETPNDNDRRLFHPLCTNGPMMKENATFQQYFHFVNEDLRITNVPVFADVIKDNYSLMDYNYNKSFFTKQELIDLPLPDTKLPCEFVYYSAKDGAIVLKNPKATVDSPRKENAGIRSRHGFTYGKYRIKAKMPELINKYGVWNGITNAIWLLNQELVPWNARRNCDKTGYMSTYWGGDNDKRVPSVSYSEIDFEILKTALYCPSDVFPPIYGHPNPDNNDINSWNYPQPTDIRSQKEDIVVACTNWDMACPQPTKFGVGCHEIRYKNQYFDLHRWSDKYRAVTSKSLQKDAELFESEYYWYEIDWKPTSITWRIGPSPDKMRVVSYMDTSITSIPNNQMILMITQEFHNTNWWPGTPFTQGNVPMPKNDIIGKIYEFIVE